jgi:hypothetical protein
MGLTTRSKSKDGGRLRNGRGEKKGRNRRVSGVNANSNAVPFRVTALAAKLLPPPAISEATEEKLPFDAAKAQRVSKSKRV